MSLQSTIKIKEGNVMKERIKKVRKENNLSQTAFGEKIGVTLGVIKNLEQGKTTLSSPLLELMCSIYSINETWLRTGEGNMFIEKQKSPILDELKEEYKLTESELRLLEGYLDLPEGDRKQFINVIHNLIESANNAKESKSQHKTIIKKVSTPHKTVSIPIYTPTAAGFGHYADDEIIGYEEVPAEWVNNFEDYCIVRVDGDSMSPKFEDNDLLLIKNQDSVDSGTIAVVLVDGEKSFVKKVVYGKGWIELVSINPEYPPLRFEGKDVLRVCVFGAVERCIDRLEQ